MLYVFCLKSRVNVIQTVKLSLVARLDRFEWTEEEWWVDRVIKSPECTGGGWVEMSVFPTPGLVDVIMGLSSTGLTVQWWGSKSASQVNGWNDISLEDRNPLSDLHIIHPLVSNDGSICSICIQAEFIRSFISLCVLQWRQGSQWGLTPIHINA